MDANDGLLVVKSAGTAAWVGVGDKVNDWLQSNL